jgi:hypothetical protein
LITWGIGLILLSNLVIPVVIFLMNSPYGYLVAVASGPVLLLGIVLLGVGLALRRKN